MVAWRGGDCDAGEALFDRHFARLARFFGTRLPGAVEDLVQRTFLRVVEHRDQFEGRSEFRTYLFAIARHELYAELRRRARPGQAFEPLRDSLTALGVGPSTHARAVETGERLRQGLAELPVELQVCLELYYWEEFSAAAIAEILDCPEGTVRTRLRRARQLLARILELRDDEAALAGRLRHLGGRDLSR